jgi:hypothetical protein
VRVLRVQVRGPPVRVLPVPAQVQAPLALRVQGPPPVQAPLVQAALPVRCHTPH